MNERGKSSLDEIIAVEKAHAILALLDKAGRRRALLKLAADLGVDLAEVDKANRPTLRKGGPGGRSGFYESSSGG